MSYFYTPNVGYGPLRFGMTRKDAEAVLGEPSSFGSPFDGIPLPDKELQRYYGRLNSWSALIRERAMAFRKFFDRDRVTALTLFDIKVPFWLDSIDLFARDRKATLVALAARKDKYFENDECFLFPSQGLSLPNAKQARKLPYIALTNATYELAHREFNGFDFSKVLS